MTIWRAGMKAVCVDDDWRYENGAPCRLADGHPRKGSVHTVFLPTVSAGVPHLILDGLPGSYEASGFRPIVDKKTDISIFQEIARNPKVPARDERQPEGVV